MSRIHYTHCPVCHSTQINPLLTVNDFSVSRQDFVVWQCSQCALRFTQDAPDEAEIGAYYQSQDYISHSNTSKGLLNQLYQNVRKHTLVQKAKLVEHYSGQKGSLLDLGAGIGAFLSVMTERGWEVKGIEPDEGARRNAKELFALTLEQPEVLFTLRQKQFSAITLWHVLEHVHQLHRTMAQLKNLLQEKGKLFIAVPNFTSVDAAAFRNYWAAYDVPRHLYHFSPTSIEALAAQHGLKVTAKKPMWYDSFYISLLSSKYHRGKIAWLQAGLTGLRSNLTALFNPDRCSSLIYIIEKNDTGARPEPSN